MTFDPTKPVQTRNGCKARIVCTDFDSARPIIALYYSAVYNKEICRYYQKNGWFANSFESDDDLINIPEVGYINIWQTSSVSRAGCYICSSYGFSSKEAAEDSVKEAIAGNSCKKFIHIGLEVEL